jgi:REP element-mobilizing transposase RayT
MVRTCTEKKGAIDRLHNTPGTPLAEVNPNRIRRVIDRMDHSPFLLDFQRRDVVLLAIRRLCSHRRWNLWAAHVRTNHVLAVIEAEVKPEKCLNDFKSYASRALNQAGIEEPGRKRWAHHGSTASDVRRKNVTTRAYGVTTLAANCLYSRLAAVGGGRDAHLAEKPVREVTLR